MDFNHYQEVAKTTAIYPESAKLMYPLLGLSGEFGEICEKVKKHIRDGKDLDKEDLTKEIGDVLWYLSAVATDLDIKLNDVVDYATKTYLPLDGIENHYLLTRLLLTSSSIGVMQYELLCNTAICTMLNPDINDDADTTDEVNNTRSTYANVTLIDLLADVMFNVINVAASLDISIEVVAETNLTKLQSRKERNVISGSGDNR